MAADIRIKICGLRRSEDISFVNEAGADYAGFVLTPSRRRVTTEEASRLISALRPSVQSVGVFAKESPEEIAQTAAEIGLDGIQLHMDTDPLFWVNLTAALRRLGVKPFLWQRIPVPIDARTAADIEDRILSFPDLFLPDALILDTVKGGTDGGSGVLFPKKPAADFLAARNVPTERIVLAGGLSPFCVAEAIRGIRPGVVDVSSGVETNGSKDKEKIFAFVNAVRQLKEEK